MFAQTMAYEFLRSAFEYDAIGARIAALGRGDIDGLLAFAARLGFTFSPYDLTVALERHIQEMLAASDVAQDELTSLLGVDDWQSILHTWQTRFQSAA